MTAAEIVKALGGRNGMARCPAHDDREPSLSVTERDGRLLTHCHAGCEPERVWDALKQRGLVGDGGWSPRDRRRPEVSTASRRPEVDIDRRREAFRIWTASYPAAHTPAQHYLQARGITIEPPPCIRYHERLRALIAAVQSLDRRFMGIQRIFLTNNRDPDYLDKRQDRGVWYTAKRSLGPIRGGVVRLMPPGGGNLQLCESVEDGLALLQMTGRPTWAVCGAAFLPSFEPPPEVRELILAPDNDAPGLDAIAKAVAQFSTSCRKLRFRQLLPPEGMDWCDVLEDVDERLAIQEEPPLDNLSKGRSWVEGFCDGV